MKVGTTGEVRQRKGATSEASATPEKCRVSQRKFWLIAGVTSCCAIWCLVLCVVALLFLAVPADFTAFEHYANTMHWEKQRLRSAQEVLEHIPPIPFPSADDPAFNDIQGRKGDDYYRMFSQGPHPRTGKDAGCQDLTGIQKEFCKISIGEGAVKNFKKYEDIRAKCDWRTEDAFDTYPTFLYLNFSDSDMKRESGYTHFSYDTTQKRIDEHRKKKGKDRIQVKVCEIQEDQYWKWKTVRIGPFYSNGGYDWHRYLIPNTTERGHSLYSAFFYGPVTREGKVIGYPPIHIHHMHSATTQCNLIGRIWNGGVPDPLFQKHMSTQWYFDIHGDRQCTQEQGGEACLHKELPEGYAQYILLPQCIFGEVNDVRPLNSPTIEFWLEHAYRWTKSAGKARPTGFYASGPGTHIHIEEGTSVASAIGYALSSKTSYQPQLYPVDDYDAPSDEDSTIWCSMEIPFDLEFVSVWIHTHHQYTYDMLWFRGHPRSLGLDSGPLVLENHYTPLRLSKAGIDRHQYKRYLYNNMERSRGEVVCKLNEDRFEDGDPGVLPKGVPNKIYDRLAMPNCSSNLRFQAGELVTLVAIHGKVTGKTTKSGVSVMHSGWNAEYVRPECTKLKQCAQVKVLTDDLHISCLESSASPRAVGIALAQSHLRNTRDNVEKMREHLAEYAMQGGGLW